MGRISFPVLCFGILGFGILYVPIAVMVAFSFNAGKLVSVWAGFSTRWYGSLITNEQLLNAFGLSLFIAFWAATIATLFGLLIAIALVRFGDFRGRLILSGLSSAPLVMPEVVTGLSLLLLFIGMEATLGWPSGRGVGTIIIAHSTFGMCFAAIVIQARLRDFDRSIEEAARDLGARLLKGQQLRLIGLLLNGLLPKYAAGRYFLPQRGLFSRSSSHSPTFF